MNKILFLLVVVLFSSCHFFGPIDSSIQTKNVNLKQEDLVGKWKLDKFSYDYLKKKENLDSIYITFNDDNTFILNNSIDLFKNKYTSPGLYDVKEIGILDNIISKGRWTIKYNDISKQSELDLNFEIGGFMSNFQVYKKENDYQLWFFQSDPDTGERLLFLKKN
ncbi:hypothetical protein ACFS5J_05110 [Flavobacterium chuncheonense]|uniref:Lipocalin-like domain-containing protein n=1 Tax=Flavobacterium chuncheonense TaxID=2026653 RepID=A0ABW5YKB8_9FLAO